MFMTIITKTELLFGGDRKQPLVFNHFSRVGFDSETGVINPTNDNYADHTLNFQVFKYTRGQKLLHRLC